MLTVDHWSCLGVLDPGAPCPNDAATLDSGWYAF